MRAQRLLAVSLIAALSVAALAGCTPTTPVAVHSPKPSASASAAEKPGITKITDVPGSGADLVGALADSKVTACSLTDGAWKVAGTVKNPTTDAATYRIYVSLLDSKGGTRALQQVDVTGLAAAATQKWSMSIPTTEDGLNCVLRVERYRA